MTKNFVMLRHQLLLHWGNTMQFSLLCLPQKNLSWYSILNFFTR